jgi:hypothetical protein
MSSLKHIRIVIILLAAASFTPAARAAAVYNAAKDFSLSANPRGAWSYGYEDQLGGPLNLYDVPTAGWRDAPNLDAWTSSALDVDPNISHNRTTSELSFLGDSIHVPANGLTIHPGPSGEPSVLRWTAPTPGRYQVTAAFRGNDQTGPTTDVHVLHNGTSLFSGEVTAYGAGPSFTRAVTVQIGDTIDFAVGRGSNADYSFDSTGVSATITSLPEPVAVVAPLFTAFALLHRRRSSSPGARTTNPDSGG